MSDLAPQSPLTWHTTNIKTAAALGYLQFPIRTQISQDERSGKVHTQFFMGEQSVGTTPIHSRSRILAAWASGDLAKLEPLHPFLQGLRAEHNNELLLDAEKQGRRIRLVYVANAHACEYRDGEELPELVHAKLVFKLADRSLVAALGTLGVPVIKIEPDGNRCIYTLPLEGHPLKQRDGSEQRYNGLNLSVRQEGSRDLALELRDPTHPLLAAYGARQVHIQIAKHLKAERRILVIRPEGTQRKAFITDNATGRVMDKVTEHFEG